MLYSIAIEAVLNVTALAPRPVPASSCIRFTRDFAFLTVFFIRDLKDSVRSSIMHKYIGVKLWFN